jgi:hypothetical protein
MILFLALRTNLLDATSAEERKSWVEAIQQASEEKK